MKTKYYFLIIALFLAFQACKEQNRFEFNADDTVPPGPPVFLSYKPLSGGARIFYNIPDEEDLLSVNAEFIASNGKPVRFSVSYFVDSLDVYGLADTIPYTLKLFSMDRSGNRSSAVDVNVIPLEPILPKVARSFMVKPAVGSFFVDWENELLQSINVYIDFSFNINKVQRSLTTAFSSNRAIERRFIMDLLDLGEQDPVEVKVRLEDMYGNKHPTMDFGKIFLMQDFELPKSEWIFPPAGTVMGSAVMCNGNNLEGRMSYLNDGIIHTGDESNYIHTNQNAPWNILIDLGDYYELSRIATWQRRFAGTADKYSKGCLYSGENVGLYNMYLWNEDSSVWQPISQHKIPIPSGLSDLEVIKQHNKTGDMAYMLPDEPGFTKPTRWFRYEALRNFDNSYTGVGATCLSEMTLYGRKSNKK